MSQSELVRSSLGRRRRLLLLAWPRLLAVVVIPDEEQREHPQNAADENPDGFSLQGHSLTFDSEGESLQNKSTTS